MHNFEKILTYAVFCMTVLFLIWRPRGMNESVPTATGAGIILLAGVVPVSDLISVFQTVSDASITLLSTIVMSIVLESIGFFRWAAYNVVRQSRGSGILLYWHITLLCFLMTLFFNNDGSILITTPIIIQIVTMLNLKAHQKIPYLLSGALVAIAASAPIGVSSLTNLIALKIVGLDLNSYVLLMFVPSMLGIGLISLLLYLYFQRDIPKKIVLFLAPDSPPFPHRIPHAYYHPRTVERWIRRRETDGGPANHPLMEHPNAGEPLNWKLFRTCIGIIVLVRASFFGGDGLGIPIEWIAIAGALLLIAVRWYSTGVGPSDLLIKTPWHILAFAFSISILVFALHHVGLTAAIGSELKEMVSASEWNAVMIIGLLLAAMSNILNNLPSVMIGTLTLTGMGLEPQTLQIAYLANMIGSDIGSLITPMGTLASLMWMFLLRKNNIAITWKQYLKVTVIVIPIGLIFSLLCLYVWMRLIS